MIEDYDLQEEDYEEENLDYHYDSRCPAILNALAIHAPIVMIGSIAVIASVLYNISEVNMIHTDSQDQESVYCNENLSLQLLNGVCTRGTVFGIDVDKSCMQWTDSEKWKAKDAENLYRYTLYDTQAKFFGIQNKTFAITNLELEASSTWPPLITYAYIAIGFTIINIILTVTSLDSDYFHNRIGIEDVDKLVLMSSTALVGSSCAFYAYLFYTTWYNSEITEAVSWTTKTCNYTSTAATGLYAVVISSLFGASSLLLSTGTLFYWYIIVDYFELCLPHDLKMKKDAENIQKENEEKGLIRQNKNRVEQGNKIAPAPILAAGASNDDKDKDEEISAPEIVSPANISTRRIGSV
jgi:hypothetical protein